GQLCLSRMDKFSIDHQVQVFVQLFLNGRKDLGMTMANITYAYARDQIDIFFPLCSVHIDALRLFYFDEQGEIRGLGNVGEEKLSVVHWSIKISVLTRVKSLASRLVAFCF